MSEKFGQLAYDAFRVEIGNKNSNGENYVDFVDLPENVKKAWINTSLYMYNLVKLDVLTERLVTDVNMRLTELKK